LDDVELGALDVETALEEVVDRLAVPLDWVEALWGLDDRGLGVLDVGVGLRVSVGWLVVPLGLVEAL
jgi:hypothetical protein